jgi:cyclopropane-fatty-acyl-phospholipid synthase
MKETLGRLLRTIGDRVPEIPFQVQFWDGDRLRFGTGEPRFTLTFATEAAAKSVFRRGSTGFREQYVTGAIEVGGNLQELLRIGLDPLVQGIKLPLGEKVAILLQYLLSFNTVKKSPRNIMRHYDLGDNFFRQYLDESMTYSCAYFRSTQDSLEQAQMQKYEHVCRKLRLKEGETLVDVGCGWGGMLLYAARHHGVKGVGCTLSENQAKYARERAESEGLSKSVTILLKDYRNVTGQFDKFVSIGMFEHVGKAFFPAFMRKAGSLLKEGGVGLLHTVGKERNTTGDPWTMKYIFPGAYVPIIDRVMRVMGENRLVPVDLENLRLHYAATLDEWARRLESNAPEIEKMAGSNLVRTWRMYLNGSAASFRWGDLRLYQILFTNGLNNDLPLTREHLYASSTDMISAGK